MKIYIIDNYDSFTYNLYQFIGEILKAERANGVVGEFEIIVKRNDEVTIDDIKTENPDRIIVSPGPGNPEDKAYFGVCAEVISELGKTIPVLGVCLGMQGIVHVFGGKVIKANLPMHGKTSPINHSGKGVFHDIPNGLEVMRYHSLVAENASFPACLELTATVGEGEIDQYSELETVRNNSGKALNQHSFEIMGIKHKEYPIYGIQFHPESFATEGGMDMIRNFLLQS
jgi:anthranilate synthase component II